MTHENRGRRPDNDREQTWTNGIASPLTSLDWDDLHYVLAVSRAQSLAGAARLLRVSHSTVIRRLKNAEAKLGLSLFDRLHDGCVPTTAGGAAVEAAQRIDDEMQCLLRRLAADDAASAGTVRLTTTESLLKVIAPICAEFIRQHPQIDLELVPTNQRKDLSRRDADVALRPSDSPGDSLRGRRLSPIRFAVYSAADHHCLGDAACSWIGLSSELSHIRPHRWIERNVGADSIAARAGSFTSAAVLAEEYAGHTVLPCYLGEALPSLKRIGSPLAEIDTELWLLVHPQMSRSLRVRTLLDYFAYEIRRLKTVFAPGA